MNTFVAILDEAFSFTDAELLEVTRTFKIMFDELRIPDRGAPKEVPLPIELEYRTRQYSMYLADRADGITPRIVPEAAHAGEMVAPTEAWRGALSGLVFTAYPDMSSSERLVTDKIISDVLGALGAKNRRATHIPVEVQRLHTT